MSQSLTPRFRWRRTRLFGVLAAVLLFTVLFADRAAAQSSEEARAIFLYNFAKFVEWPPSVFPENTTPVTIAVVGSESVAKALERYVRGKNANGRDLVVKKLGSADGSEAGHIVYVGDGKLIPAVISAIAGKPILTVAEEENFLKTGGGIRLFEKDGKIMCAINMTVTNTAGLKLSEKLVKASSS